MNLYKINDAIEDIFDSIDDMEGEITPEIEEKLNQLVMKKEEVIKNVAFKYKDLDSFIARIDNESKRLADLKKQVKNKMEGIKRYLVNNVGPDEKIKTPEFEIGWRKSETVDYDPLLDLKSLHIHFPDLIKEKTEYSVDKAAVKKYKKDHGVLPQGFTIQQHNNIQVR